MRAIHSAFQWFIFWKVLYRSEYAWYIFGCSSSICEMLSSSPVPISVNNQFDFTSINLWNIDIYDYLVITIFTDKRVKKEFLVNIYDLTLQIFDWQGVLLLSCLYLLSYWALHQQTSLTWGQEGPGGSGRCAGCREPFTCFNWFLGCLARPNGVKLPAFSFLRACGC